jgi:hypothetical protein
MVGGGQKHDKEPKTCKEVGYCVSMTQQISYTVRGKSRSVLDTIRGCDEISDVSSDSQHVDVVGIRDAGPLDQRDRRLGVRSGVAGAPIVTFTFDPTSPFRAQPFLRGKERMMAKSNHGEHKSVIIVLMYDH